MLRRNIHPQHDRTVKTTTQPFGAQTRQPEAQSAAYGRLCRLISAGRMAKLDGEWQDKGACEIDLAMLAAHSEGVHLVLVPPGDLDAELTVAVESIVVPFARFDSHEDTKARRYSACGAAAFNSDGAPSRTVRIDDNACGATRPLRVFASSRDAPPSSVLSHPLKFTSTGSTATPCSRASRTIWAGA